MRIAIRQQTIELSPSLLIEWSLVFLAAVFRLAQFLFNKPLWGDEWKLIDNILSRSFLELAQPLDHLQSAPLGFLWLQKFMALLFGDSAFTLRLIPLIVSLASIYLLYELTRPLHPYARILILGLFASSNWLIYYAAEVKQYSLDVFVTLALVLLYQRARRPLLLGIAGAVAVWFSHAALFVLAGIGAVWFWESRRRWQVIGVGAVWALSFAVGYVLVYRHAAAEPVLLEYWRTEFDAFMRLDPIWFARALFELGFLAAGLYQPALVMLLLTGFVIALRTQPRASILIVVIPLLAALGASAVEKFPFNGRLLLWTIPLLLLLSGGGLGAFVAAVGEKRRWLAAALIVFVLAIPFSRVNVAQLGWHG